MLSSLKTFLAKPFAGFRAADVSKLNNDWMPEHLSGDSAIAESYDMLTRRNRDMFNNDPVFQKVDQQLTTLVVGEWLYPFAAAVDPSGNLIEDYNDETDILFDRWANEEADADGEKSLWEMQRLSFSETTKVGSSLWLRVINNDPERISPLSYKLIESEQLARDYDYASGYSKNGKRIQNGIEYDRNGKKVAYWVYLDHPYDTSMSSIPFEPTRIPADRIIHNYFPSRISDSAGISWYTALMLIARDRDKVIANTLTALGVSALLTLVVKEASRNSCAGMGTIDPDTGKSKVKMGYPFIARIGHQDSVEVAESKKGVFELQSFLQHIQVLEAQAAKMSVNRTTGDPSKANMASIEASHADDSAIMAPIRQHQVKRIARGIRKEWTSMTVAAGRIKSITADHYLKNKWRYNEFDVISSGRPDINKQQTVDSIVKKLRSGLTNMKIECARMGVNWRQVLRGKKQVEDFCKQIGVTLDWSEGQGGPEASVVGKQVQMEEPADAK